MDIKESIFIKEEHKEISLEDLHSILQSSKVGSVYISTLHEQTSSITFLTPITEIKKSTLSFYSPDKNSYTHIEVEGIEKISQIDTDKIFVFLKNGQNVNITLRKS